MLFLNPKEVTEGAKNALATTTWKLKVPLGDILIVFPFGNLAGSREVREESVIVQM